MNLGQELKENLSSLDHGLLSDETSLIKTDFF